MIQAREEDAFLRSALSRIDHPASAAEVRAERAVLASLGGSCDTPVGAMAVAAPEGGLTVTAVILQPDGSMEWRSSASGSITDAERLGKEVGTSLANQCDPVLLTPTPGASIG